MPISSIDVSTIAPRSSEASSLVGKEQQQIQHTGDMSAANFQRNVEQQNQRPVEANKSEKEYSFDGSGKNGYQGSRKKKNKKQSEEAPMAPKSDSSFDITI